MGVSFSFGWPVAGSFPPASTSLLTRGREYMEWHWFANFLPYLTTETECTSGDPLGPLVVTPGEVGVTSGLIRKVRELGLGKQDL